MRRESQRQTVDRLHEYEVVDIRRPVDSRVGNVLEGIPCDTHPLIELLEGILCDTFVNVRDQKPPRLPNPPPFWSPLGLDYLLLGASCGRCSRCGLSLQGNHRLTEGIDPACNYLRQPDHLVSEPLQRLAGIPALGGRLRGF